MPHTPSKYQAAVYSFIESGTGNAVIDAVAGSGKSTTLVESLKKIPPHQTVLFLAFNKSIVEELKIKAGNMSNVQIYTLHGMGASAVNRSLWDVETNADKYKKFIHSMDARGFLTPDTDLEPAEHKEFKSNIFQLIDLCRLNLCNDKLKAKELACKHDIHLLSNEIKYAFRAIKWGLQNEEEIDFTDMIFFPIIKKMRVQQYDWVFIDECQDLNICQRELFLKCLKPGGRFIAVGDPAQCQPKGTKVLMADFTEKNIEDIKVGDSVVSYDTKKCQFTGFGSACNVKPVKVLETAKSTRRERIFTVTLDSGHTSEYSSNHRCYVQFNPSKMQGKYVLYLMQKAGSFRVGIYPCDSVSKGNGFAPVMRARSEGAESMWILQIFNNKKDAYLQEQIISARWSIPQMRFKNNTVNSLGLNQNDIDTFWSSVGDLTDKAIRLLEGFNRDICYPLWVNQGKNNTSWKLSTFAMFKTQACNILPEIMDMCIFDPSNRDLKNRVRRYMVGIKLLAGSLHQIVDLYSLNVESNHNYVADGILTSNCIYGFAGADIESFRILQNLPDTVTLPLSVCYRCDGDIIRLAKTIVPHIEAREGAPAGIVDREAKLSNVQDGDMILCRLVSPLVDVCITYIKQGVKAYIKGGDIGANLVKMIQNTNREAMEDVMIIFEKELAKIALKYSKSTGCSLQEARESSDYQSYEDKVSAISIISDGIPKSSAVVARILTIFSDKNQGICLSTIHKSKGLECDRVFILCPEKMMHAKSMQIEWMAEQERNLVYVAYTRARHYLGFITDYQY
jgi:hypothetical protein